jgi:hypothetical protein
LKKKKARINSCWCLEYTYASLNYVSQRSAKIQLLLRMRREENHFEAQGTSQTESAGESRKHVE